MDIYKKLGTVECIDNYKNDNYHPLDLLVCREVKLIVDTICIRGARGELINIKNIFYNCQNLLSYTHKYYQKNDSTLYYQYS